MMMPKPKPNPAIKSKSNGKANAQRVSCTAEPRIMKYARKARKKANWMAKVIRSEMMIEMGVTRRGKVHLAKEVRIGGKRGGGAVETAGEVAPQYGT